MEPTVVVALIGAAATITAALVTGFLGRRREQRSVKKTEVAAASMGRELAGDAPYALQRLEVEYRFDDDGKGEQLRRWVGLRANQHIQNLEVPFQARISCPGGKFGAPEAKEIGDSPLTVSIRELVQTDLTSNGKVRLNGQCGPGTKPSSFYVKHPFEKAFCLTRHETEDAYKNDDWPQEVASGSVPVPTNDLYVTVSFPPSHGQLKPEPSPVVFFGGSEVVHSFETSRVQSTFKYADGKAALTVPNPVIGLLYAISWMPP